MWIVRVVFCLIFVNAQAASLNIVTTGDSNVTGFSPNNLMVVMSAKGITGKAMSTAGGGVNASIYVGDAIDTAYFAGPTFHNQARDALFGPVQGFGPPYTYGSVIDNHPEPDAVTVMLGTNDAILAQGNMSVWETYKTDMTRTFDYLLNTATPGGHPDLFVMTPIPILAQQYASADAFLSSTLNPWLRNEVAEYQAEGYSRIHLIDTNALIREQPNWQTWYNDGVHLYAANGAGYTWLANQVILSVMNAQAENANQAVVPLPGSLWVFGSALFGLFAARKKRQVME